VVLVYGGLMSAALLWLTGRIVPLRVGSEAETEGLDIALHDERGYNL
jgi:Amt family ammonium transporter